MNVITTKWIDQNKGGAEKPNYRARLVAREVVHDKREDLFAATSPFESLRVIIFSCAPRGLSKKSEDSSIIITTNDVKPAYFDAPATREIYNRIPKDD